MQTTDIIKDMLAHIAGECKAIDREARFDDMLDECYSFDTVGGPFACMSPSRVLKECDPVAYRCGVNDWADGERWVEIDGEYYDSDEVDDARDEFVSDLEMKMRDLEAQLEDGEGAQLDLEKEIEDLEAGIKSCESYRF